MNAWWHHTSSMEACCVCSVVLLHLKKKSRLTLTVLDSAPMLFTPETPEVFCGLKQFTHSSIVTGLSRIWVDFHFSVNYPFKSACITIAGEMYKTAAELLASLFSAADAWEYKLKTRALAGPSSAWHFSLPAVWGEHHWLSSFPLQVPL